MQIVNKNEIRIIGLQRSGNHAIIEWIIRQCKGKVCFLNDIKAYPLGIEKVLYEKINDEIILKNINNKLEYKEILRLKKDYLIYSYEDKRIKCLKRNNEKLFGKSLKKYYILILRDPFNLFASRIKLEEKRLLFGFKLNKKIKLEKIMEILLNKDTKKNRIIRLADYLNKNFSKKRIINLWKEHAAAYLMNFTNKKFIVINYNKWFKEKKYRQEISKKLRLKYKEPKGISFFGGGSSFDNIKYYKNPYRMKVLERWKQYVNNNTYKNIFKDKELIELSDKIFGKIPNTEILKNY